MPGARIGPPRPPPTTKLPPTSGAGQGAAGRGRSATVGIGGGGARTGSVGRSTGGRTTAAPTQPAVVPSLAAGAAGPRVEPEGHCCATSNLKNMASEVDRTSSPVTARAAYSQHGERKKRKAAACD